MRKISSHCCGRSCRTVLALILLSSLFIFIALPVHAQSLFRQLSQDSFSGGSGQHMTEVEPSAFAYGPTIVVTFQVARIYGGGGMDIGFATSTNSGIAWTNGYLPGLTQWYQGGTNSAASDPSVAYDLKHNQWLICTLTLGSNYSVAVSRSSDGLHWGNPIYVTSTIYSDKNWINCDNNPTSPYYGNCYVEFDSPSDGDLIFMSTSSDGGATWGPAMTTAGSDYGLGGNIEVMPNGTVVVAYADFNGGISAFTSTNGGQSWNAAVSIASAPSKGEDGGLRNFDLPSATIDGAGTVYVSWSDCRFESGCNANDIVFSTSTDGIHWSSVVRVAADPVGSGVDHFLPGLGIDPKSSGNTAHIGLTYYYYPVSNCGSSCTLYAGWTQSSDGGATWSKARQLSSGMQLSWLPQTLSGYMVGDYFSTVFTGPRAFPIYMIAYQPTSGIYHQAAFTEGYGFSFGGGQEETLSSTNDMPIPDFNSYVRPREFYDQDEQVPVHPNKAVPPDKR